MNSLAASGSPADEPGAELVIRVYPDHGHPSSLWASKALVLFCRPPQPYLLPSQLGIDGALGARILAWTRLFQEFFVTEVDDFSARPRWRPGVDTLAWHDEGCEIVRELRTLFPQARVEPGFAQYVFSVNERRESLGRPPLSLPGDPKPGHIDSRDFIRDPDRYNG